MNQQQIFVNTEHHELRGGYVVSEIVERRMTVQPLNYISPPPPAHSSIRLVYKKAVVIAGLALAVAPGAALMFYSGYYLLLPLVVAVPLHLAAVRLNRYYNSDQN